MTPYIRLTNDAEGTRPGPLESFICAIGDNRVRKEVGGNTNVVHPTAILSEGIDWGQGIFVAGDVFIGPKVKIGDGAIINTGAICEHECIIGAYAHIASGAVLSGKVEIGEGALIGAGVVIRLGQKVGAWAVVGCGAVVVHDLRHDQTYVGNPARRIDPKNEKRG